MNKLKTAIFNNILYIINLSRAELLFVFYLCGIQDDNGVVRGVYYKDSMKAMGICHETFYNVLKSLQKKKIISFVRTCNWDYDITLIGNDFSNGDYSDGYISLRYKIYTSTEFMKLKGNEMLLLMDIFRMCQMNHNVHKIGEENFVQKYAEAFGVTHRTIRKYIRSLKKFFDVNIEQGNYIFKPKKMLNSKVEHSDEQIVHKHLVKTMARRHKIKNPTEQEIAETAKLVNQYRGYAEIAGCNIWSVLKECLESSIDIINQYKKAREKKEYSLRYKLIHKLVRQCLKMA